MTLTPKQRMDLQKEIVRPAQISEAQPGWGTVLWFDPQRNVANVLLSRPGSDLPGEVYQNVPCPLQVGVQTTGPEVGRTCWVMFKNGNSTMPVITSFFNYDYQTIDHARHTNAPQVLPGFMLEI